MAKILIIEDDEKFRKMLRFLLEESGHKIFEAADGREGMSIFRRGAVDLIITDIFMPEQDGLGVLREVIKGYPDMKTIVISGGGKIGAYQYLEYAEQFGADKTLAKPFENEELLAIVDELLAQ
ncbi:MAG: response regulator [Desulfobacteraceae bacterium]|nr:response regulator [Desulfobacteraceae bacterium]